MEQLLQKEFIGFANRQNLFESTDLIIVAISGGMDSVVLTHLLKTINQNTVLAHCNFQLRGNESHRDEQFIRNLSAQWEIPLFVETYQTEAYALAHKLSIQVAARQLRYDFFERLREKLSKPGQRVLIATGHHANDAAETMLLHLFRGTGIDGLRGIPVKNGKVIRPMLFATRDQVFKYAQEKGLSWVEDSSNAKPDYTRNFIRNKVLPIVENQFPTLVSNLSGTISKVNEAAALYHEMVELKLAKLVVKEGDIQKVPVRKLEKAGQRNTLIWEWIKPFGFSEGQVGEVVKLLEAGNGSLVTSSGHRLLRNRAWLLMSPLGVINSAPVVIDRLPADQIFSENNRLTLSRSEWAVKEQAIPGLPQSEAWVDAGKFVFPLILRPWKAGDYFYPLGMAKKKKVARFLIDKKLSPGEKENTWVLESDKRIVWVVGYRIDDRFKITGSTREVVKMKVVND